MGLRCLIVDDYARYCEAARALLESEGITVVGVATSGDECAWLLRRFRPDVVLIDIYLGAESGFQLADGVASGAFGARATVILMSIRDERDFLDLIEESPAIGFLAKRSLSAADIHTLLERAAGEGRVSARRET